MRDVGPSTPAARESAGDPIVVRAIDPAEFDAVGRLTVAAYRAGGQLDGDHGYADVLADVASRATEGEVLVAVDEDSTVLGSVMFVLPGSRYCDVARAGEAEFRMLAVDPAAQRRGVGAALVRACVDRAVQVGASAVVICTRDFSHHAHRLYERLGFVRVPELDWVPVPGVTLVALRRDLRAA